MTSRGLVSDVFDGDLKIPERPLHDDSITLTFAGEGTAEGRLEIQPPLGWVGLVGSHQKITAGLARLVFNFDGSAKSNHGTIDTSRPNDLCRIQSLGEEAHASIDLPQSLFAVNVFGILRSITLRRRVGHFLHDAWPLHT